MRINKKINTKKLKKIKALFLIKKFNNHDFTEIIKFWKLISKFYDCLLNNKEIKKVIK